jgi:hypothetical protein
MSEIAASALPSALPPTEAELVAWNALTRDEQLMRYRELLLSPDACRISDATMQDVLTEARQLVAARRA